MTIHLFLSVLTILNTIPLSEVTTKWQVDSTACKLKLRLYLNSATMFFQISSHIYLNFV